MRYSDAKNKITNQAFEEPPVPTVGRSSVIGFSSNKKEQSYHRTNQSSINMLQSFKTLDLQDKDVELELIPESQGNVLLAENLNRKSQLDQVSSKKHLSNDYSIIMGDKLRFLMSTSLSSPEKRSFTIFQIKVSLRVELRTINHKLIDVISE